MPKVRRASSLSLDRSRASPYPCTSDDSEPYNLKNPLESKENVKEWEEARCPICIEHPHNAVLLKCSSHEKGCRPFMCNTSYRHSNCLDQFCKSSLPCCSTPMLQELPLTITTSHSANEEQSSLGQTSPCGSQLEPKPVCPLCRGEIYGYVVVEAARHYMNCKVRNCSSETCDFNGTYSELRKHARSQHPSVRPSEVDPNRHSDWVRLERERDLEDVLSLVQQGPAEDIVDEESGEFSSWMTNLFSAMFRSLEVMLVTRLMDSSSGSSSGREQTHNRRSGRLPRAHYDNDSISVTRRSNILSDSTSRPRGLRWRAPNNDVEISRAPRWSQNSLSGETGHASRWSNNFIPEPNSRAPRWSNNSLSDETNRARRWGNNSLSEETSRAPGWGNNSLPEEASRAPPRWSNTSVPENAPQNVSDQVASHDQVEVLNDKSIKLHFVEKVLMARSLSKLLCKGISFSGSAARSAIIAPGSFYINGMRYSTTVPNEPDTHDDFKPTNKLENSGLTLKDLVEQDVKDNPVMLYMKGVPDLPQCGFSSLAVRVLKQYNVPLGARNVLEDPELKSAVKTFSHWPTFPQIFIKGEFIGGSDIILNMHQTGELKEKLQDISANQEKSE
ncbi:unnamed protein product [Prunus brigantina]